MTIFFKFSGKKLVSNCFRSSRITIVVKLPLSWRCPRHFTYGAWLVDPTALSRTL